MSFATCFLKITLCLGYLICAVQGRQIFLPINPVTEASHAQICGGGCACASRPDSNGGCCCTGDASSAEGDEPVVSFEQPCAPGSEGFPLFSAPLDPHFPQRERVFALSWLKLSFKRSVNIVASGVVAEPPQKIPIVLPMSA